MSHRVVLVRAARSSSGAGGGCCSGDVRPFDPGGGHRHPAAPDAVGHVYRELRSRLPHDVDVQLVSPSNWAYLLPVLVLDGRCRGLRGRALARSVRIGLATSSLVVDGAVLHSGGLPDPGTAVEAVEAALVLR